MCIFTRPVESVSNTRIAVGLVAPGRQLTVYENAVSIGQAGTAMVLPVPNGGPIDMLDLSKEDWSWKALDDAYFPKPMSPSWGGTGGFAFGMQAKGPSRLAVVTCGGYLVSVAKTMQDLARVDDDVFTLPANIQEVLQKHYGEGFGFVVCKFQKGKTSGHPIAYTHSPLKDGRLFIPTRHEHGNEAPAVDLYEADFGKRPVVHTGVWCDGCKRTPIEGTRWKCQGCPDFDFCNTCFMEDKTHKRRHMFTMMDQPNDAYEQHAAAVSGWSTSAVGQSWLRQGSASSKDHLDFDHTLYMFNCILLASSFITTDLRTAEKPHLHVQLGFLSKLFPVLRCAQRVEIKAEDAYGPSFHIENGDYFAAHVEK